MGGELGKSLVRTVARSPRATAIEGLSAETSRVVSSARQFQTHRRVGLGGRPPRPPTNPCSRN